MRRILIITENAYPRNLTASERTESWMRDFPHAGFEPVLLTPHYGENSTRDFEPSLLGKLTGRRICVPIPRRLPGECYKWLKCLMPVRGVIGRRLYFRMLRAGRTALAAEKFDLILTTTPHLYGIFMAQTLSRQFKIPYAVDFRDIPGELGEFEPAALERLWSCLLRGLDGVSMLSTVSEPLAAALRHRVPGVPVHVVYNGFRAYPIPPVSPPSDGKLHVVYAGTLYESMRYSILFDALDRLMAAYPDAPEDLSVDFYGFASDDLKLLKKCCAGEGDRLLSFGGYVPREEALRIQESADVNLMFPALAMPGVISSKLFVLTYMKRPLWLIPEDGTIAPFLSQLGYSAFFNDVESVFGALEKMLLAFRADKIRPAPVKLNDALQFAYTREAQSEKLAAHLTAVLETT